MSALQAFVTGQTQTASDFAQEQGQLERQAIERDTKFRNIQQMMWQMTQSEANEWFEAHRN